MAQLRATLGIAAAVALLAVAVRADPSRPAPTYLWADGLFGGKGVLIDGQSWSCQPPGSPPAAGSRGCPDGQVSRIDLVRRADSFTPELTEAFKSGRSFARLNVETLFGDSSGSRSVLSVSGARIVADAVDAAGVERISIVYAELAFEGISYDEPRPASIQNVPVAITTYTGPPPQPSK